MYEKLTRLASLQNSFHVLLSHVLRGKKLDSEVTKFFKYLKYLLIRILRETFKHVYSNLQDRETSSNKVLQIFDSHVINSNLIWNLRKYANFPSWYASRPNIGWSVFNVTLSYLAWYLRSNVRFFVQSRTSYTTKIDHVTFILVWRLIEICSRYL